MMHRDVDLLKIGKIKPSEKYPPAFGAPPRIETRDIKPLPFGYGQGSSTKALWLMEQAKKVYNGVSPPHPNPPTPPPTHPHPYPRSFLHGACRMGESAQASVPIPRASSNEPAHACRALSRR